jgi:energy-coupling factor transport system ATP-binding protein
MAHGRGADKSAMQIQLNDVSFTYNKQVSGKLDKLTTPPALHPIQLSFGDSEMIAVAGRSGSGKTTLLHLLKGLLKPSGGVLSVQGRDPWQERTPDVFNEIGLVFQYPEHQLFAATVFDDIAFGPRSRYGKQNKDAVNASVTEAMERVELDFRTYADRSPFELSGGEKRKVAIAGVLALKPKVLLLDEPTAGLDLHARQALFNLLQDLRKETGMTVIWVSHQLPEVLTHAKRLLWLDGGRLVKDGDAMNILSDPSFLKGMGMTMPESLSLRERLLSIGFSGLHRPWDTVQMADELLRQRNDGVRNGGR